MRASLLKLRGSKGSAAVNWTSDSGELEGASQTIEAFGSAEPSIKMRRKAT